MGHPGGQTRGSTRARRGQGSPAHGTKYIITWCQPGDHRIIPVATALSSSLRKGDQGCPACRTCGGGEAHRREGGGRGRRRGRERGQINITKGLWLNGFTQLVWTRLATL